MYNLNSERGITLIETLIALVVLSISLLGLSALQTTAIRGNASAAKLSTSIISGSDRIEQLLNAPYNDPALDINNSPYQETSGLAPGISSIVWTVAPYDANGDGDTIDADEQGIKDVTITVNYSAAGGAKTTQIKFLRAQVY